MLCSNILPLHATQNLPNHLRTCLASQPGSSGHAFGPFSVRTPPVTCKPAAPPNFQTRWGWDSAPPGQLPRSSSRGGS